MDLYIVLSYRPYFVPKTVGPGGPTRGNIYVLGDPEVALLKSLVCTHGPRALQFQGLLAIVFKRNLNGPRGQIDLKSMKLTLKYLLLCALKKVIPFLWYAILGVQIERF